MICSLHAVITQSKDPRVNTDDQFIMISLKESAIICLIAGWKVLQSASSLDVRRRKRVKYLTYHYMHQ